jgi:predicted ribosome quality control (RQC) complex YloA/Tae2 family protein
MARIAGVDIPREKRTVISLTYIFGVGPTTAQQICEATGVDESTRVKDLSEADVNKLRAYIDQNLTVEGAPRTSSARWRSTACRGSATARACPFAASARAPTPAPARDQSAPSPVRRRLRSNG